MLLVPVAGKGRCVFELSKKEKIFGLYSTVVTALLWPLLW